MNDVHLVSLKKVAPDLVIRNAIVFNSITGEFLSAHNIWVKGDVISYVGEDSDPLTDPDTKVIDAHGSVVLPGLIEGHTHILNFTGVEEFVRHVIPSGTTTVVTETIELASVVGLQGFTQLIKGLRDQPIRLYYTISPLCGLTVEEERVAPAINEYKRFFEDPMCLGLGEIYWGNMLLASEQGERVRSLAKMARSYGKVIEGHTAGASKGKLQAYTAFGVGSCHEPISEQEAIERLRLGYWVMIRQGAIRKELNEVVDVFSTGIDTRRVVICTDSMDPETFLTEGSLDAAVRRAIELGVAPEKVYQSVTINVAEHFHLEHLIGSLTPGKKADMVLIPAPSDYQPQAVICRGKVIYEGGEVKGEVRKVIYPDHFFRTVRLSPPVTISMPQRGKVRVMELVTRLVTIESSADLGNPDERQELNLLLALERTGKGGMFLGMIKGFGLASGAVGTTMCWDTQDMFVVGCDEESMLTVINRLRQISGGAVVAKADQVVSEYPAQLCGIVSIQNMEAARTEIKEMENVLAKMGVTWDKPLLTLNTLGTAAIPHLRITHHGYVRLKDRAILPLEFNESKAIP